MRGEHVRERSSRSDHRARPSAGHADATALRLHQVEASTREAEVPPPRCLRCSSARPRRTPRARTPRIRHPRACRRTPSTGSVLQHPDKRTRPTPPRASSVRRCSVENARHSGEKCAAGYQGESGAARRRTGRTTLRAARRSARSRSCAAHRESRRSCDARTRAPPAGSSIPSSTSSTEAISVVSFTSSPRFDLTLPGLDRRYDQRRHLPPCECSARVRVPRARRAPPSRSGPRSPSAPFFAAER